MNVIELVDVMENRPHDLFAITVVCLMGYVRIMRKECGVIRVR